MRLVTILWVQTSPKVRRPSRQRKWRRGFSWGYAFLSRRINDSFAVVQVPDYSGVGIYCRQPSVGRTDAKGNALLPSLRPYEKNSVRIEQS